VRDHVQVKTAPVPMRCDRCGREFPLTPMIGVGGGSQFVTVRNNTGGCPYCGGSAHQVVNVEFSVDPEGRLELLQALRPPGVEVGDYERALAMIQAGQARNATPDEIADQVEAAAPRLSRLAALIREKPIEFTGLVVAILTLLLTGGLQAADVVRHWDDNETVPAPAQTAPTVPAPPPITEAQLRRLIDEACQRQARSGAGTPQQPGESARRPGRAPARNAPCTCGSDRKYKHCCGRPG
jgi:hypothetical protein